MRTYTYFKDRFGKWNIVWQEHGQKGIVTVFNPKTEIECIKLCKVLNK
jgi:hypothetical protein